MATAKSLRQLLLRLSRSRNHDELNRPAQLCRIPPFGKLTHMITTDQIKQAAFRETLLVIANCIDGVGDASSLQFLKIDLAISSTNQSKPEHLQPNMVWR